MWEWVGERHAADYRLAIWSAWNAAAFTRQQRLPDLESVMRRFENGGRVESQTPDQIKSNVLIMVEAFGGKVKRDG